MANVLIAFYSRDGATERLAEGIAVGVREAGGDVVLRRAREVVGEDVMRRAEGWTERARAMNERYERPTEADAEWADAIIFGSPTRFGSVAAELKAYIDSLGGLWFQGKLNGKVGSAFTTTSTTHGGNETTILSLYTPLAHLGLIIVPLGYGDPAVFRAGTPYGASIVAGSDGKSRNDDELIVARYQGRRVTEVAAALTLGTEIEGPVEGSRA